MTGLSLTRRQALVLAGVLAVVLVLAGKLLTGGSGHAARVSFPLARAAPPPSPPPMLVVDVAGAVRQPGLYRLPKGSRIADAVAKAGGATGKAAVDGVNLAAPLADGEQVVVPSRVPGGGLPVAAPGGSSAAASGPVSLSTATVEQLDALPGIGPVTAQKIVDYRTAHGPFQTVDELDAISGIGPAKLDQLRGLVVP
jgi:competence protein ComEA